MDEPVILTADELKNEKERTDSKFRYTLHQMNLNKSAYLLIAPFFLVFGIFILVPVIMSLPMGFTDFNMVQFPKFVGFDNFYTLLLADDVFLIAVKNTLIMAILTGPVSYILCFVVAWFINNLGHTLKTIFTFIFYAPSICTNMYAIWRLMFSDDMNGLVNSWLIELGILNGSVQWLTDARYMLPVVIIVQMWMSLGVSFLAMIAGLQGVDKSMYEAGAIEGIKNRFQEMIHITLPAMGPQLMFAAVMQITSAFNCGYVGQMLTGFPSTDYATHTIYNHAYDYGWIRYEMGYASAIMFILFLAMIICNAIIKKVLHKYLDD